MVEGEKNVEPEKPAGQEDGVDANKENPPSEVEEKEPEEKVSNLFACFDIVLCGYCLDVMALDSTCFLYILYF